MPKLPISAKPYRFNVGIALFNARGRIFLGKSIPDGPEHVWPGFEWQMPQGGIDPSEEIIAAARRELKEETGITAMRFLAVTDEWWRYDFPEHVPTGHHLEAFAGQQQRWAAFLHDGQDSKIDLTTSGQGFQPEFSAWRWATLAEAVAGVMPYKQANYRKMAAAFARFADGSGARF